MIGDKKTLISSYLLTIFPLIWTHAYFAAASNVRQVDTFIRSIITALTGIAGLVATGFFVLGGFKYITSSGNPHNLEHAKRTIVFSALGLAITIAAFVLSNIVTSLASSAFGG